MGIFQFLIAVWFLILVPSTSCPVTCRCTTTARLSADCSYRELRHVPPDLPIDLNQLTLTVNQISNLNATSFGNSLGLTALWLAYNKITTINPGTFRSLSQLVHLDLSYNQLADFPWSDLSTLEKLQILNLNNNQLVTLPSGSFNNSKNLRSLQLSSNRLYSLPEGIFHTLTTLSHLQLHSNAFHCSCSLEWLMDWIQKVGFTIDRKGDIVCVSPKELTGVPLEKVPNLECKKPLEIMGDDSLLVDTLLLCREIQHPYFMVIKDSSEQKSYEIEVTIRKHVNGSFAVTTVKQGMVYLCQVYNYTSESAGEYSVSLAHYAIAEWPREKLVLFHVSERVRSETNEGSCVLTAPSLFWQALLLVLWHSIP